MYRLKRPVAIFMALTLLFVSTAYAAPSDAVSAENSDSDASVAETAISGEVTRVREDVSLRTTNSETYLLSDGTYECVVYAEDKYYTDENNTLVRIDNSIVRW